MQAYICDQCGKREEPDRIYNLPPNGWYTLNQRKVGESVPVKHLCSEPCLQLTCIQLTEAGQKVVEAVS